MAYFLLITGILIIIFASRSINTSAAVPVEPTPADMNFSNILSDNAILQRLDVIEEKLDIIEGRMLHTRQMDAEYIKESKYEKIEPAVEEDLNNRIFKMKDDGLSVEEISDRLGILKGEVLLRIGMRR